MSKRTQFNDWNPEKFKYDSKKKRELNKRIKILLFMIVIAIFAAYTVHKCFAMASCVETHHGYYVRDICPKDKCCEPLPEHNPNQPWLQ